MTTLQSAIERQELTFRNGFLYPCHDGKVLSWSIGLYFTAAEQAAGYQKMRAVIRAMWLARPKQLFQERNEMVRSLWGPFKDNANRCLQVIDEEVSYANQGGVH